MQKGDTILSAEHCTAAGALSARHKLALAICLSVILCVAWSANTFIQHWAEVRLHEIRLEAEAALEAQKIRQMEILLELLERSGDGAADAAESTPAKPVVII